MSLIVVNENALKLVAESYEKTEEHLKKEVAELKEWMEKQSHLPEVIEDHGIQNIYLGNKCKMDKTKEKLDGYYTMRTQKAHMFKLSNPKLPNMKRVTEAIYFTMLPKMTGDMYRVFVFKARDKELVNDVDPYSYIYHMVNVQEIRIHEDVAFGDVFLYDFDGVGLRFFFKFTPIVIYNSIRAYEKFFSSRLKAMYLINAPSYMEKILAIAKIFMKPKLFGRVHVCTDASAVLTGFPRNILPEDYGGEEKSLEELNEQLISKFDEYQERFDRLDQLRVDESLRPKKHP